MAKKPLIFVGIEGKLPRPLPKRGFIVSEQQALLPFGTLQRKENDHIKAIDVALQAQSDQCKIFVIEKSVEFNPQAPAFDWNEIVPESFDNLTYNQIQVSSTIASTYQKYFDFDTQANYSLLQHPKKTKQRLRGLTSSYETMVGRQSELFELQEILEQSFEDRGQISSIVGEGGLGKTRLWVEFEKYLEQKQVLYFFGSFSQQDETDYSAFRHILMPLAQHFKSQISFTETEQAVLEYLLDPTSDNTFIKTLTQANLDQNIQYLVRNLLTQIAPEKIAFILDDIHWADEKSKQLIEYLVSSIPKRLHMWLLIHRPDYIPPFSRELFYHQVPLSALDADQVESQIKNMFKFKYIAPSTLRKIHEHSKGNPFFVEEIFRHSLENNIIQKDTKILREMPLAQGQIPMNIQAMVQARLDKLPPHIFQSLKKLSILGSEIYREEALALLGQDCDDPNSGENTVNFLLQESYLAEVSVFPDNKIGFYHDIIFETLRENNISQAEFTHFHTSIAQLLLASYTDESSFKRHLFRICDHFTHVPYAPTHKNLFEKAAHQATQQNHFTLSEKYLSHLFQHDGLDKKLYVDYAQALNNTDKILELENFLAHWGKTATVESEDPNTGYYYTRIKLLRQQAKFPQLQKICTDVLDQYRKTYSDKELNSIISLNTAVLALQYKWKEHNHIALKQLRLFNGEKHSIKKIPYLNGLASYSHNQTSQNNKFELDFIYKAMYILDSIENPPYSQQNIVLSRYAFFQTVQKCNYALSAKIWNKIIEIRKKNGIFSDLDSSYVSLVTSYFFAGQYDEAIEAFDKINDLTQQNRTRHYYHVTFWTSLMHLVLGNVDTFKKLIIQARAGNYKEPWFRTIRFYCMAHFHIHKKNHYNAYISFKRLLRMYKKINIDHVTVDAALLTACSKAEHYGQISADDIPDIRKWMQTPRHSQSYNHWSFQIHALTLARFIDIDLGIDPLSTTPADCPNAFLKQKMYIEKIKFLDFKGMHEEATSLREEYTMYRKQLEIKIPYEHKDSFRKKSLFPVPE